MNKILDTDAAALIKEKNLIKTIVKGIFSFKRAFKFSLVFLLG